ncbi:MAG TPA: hypothetical protein VGU02_05750 [Gaiellaceae bacterium]|nr:hypothetical protein [Gaiellaceae bacterium]
MTDVPDRLTLKRHRDLEGISSAAIWMRRAILGLIAVLCLAGLANVFGQRPESASADVPAAKISLYAPSAIRGGDFMEARFHITAKRDIKKATLKLDPGWAEGLSVNEIEPSPLGQASDNGRLSLTLGHIPAGQSFILFMQFQVNPTNLAWRRPQNVELDDGDQVLAIIHHSLTVYP